MLLGCWEPDVWRHFRPAFLACLVILAFARGVSAQDSDELEGVALIIGQSGYEHIAKLPNPENDARAVEDVLNGLGFETDVSPDRNARRLRRDLEGFVEDADGADVAIIYYSGHGIEAGGENFLVPVDADISSLENASDQLVSLTDVVAKLKKTVPLTIILLDACRENPFPPGTMLKKFPAGTGSPVSARGLGETRGVVALSSGNDEANPDQSLGQIIGFAAEPGKVALDGDPGGNSPYAAAILRHLETMGGEEFGTVLRMIGEEVYLKTGGRQRPWVNESLRRLLYFGIPAKSPKGEEGQILAERRQLLLTIATLPDIERKQVEAIAKYEKVPMDALFGLLKALSAHRPQDPNELQKILQTQAAAIKEKQERLLSLDLDDEEVERLIKLADQALKEGALEANARLMDAATRRYEQIVRPRLDGIETALRASRLDGAALYERTAKAHEIKFDFAVAAQYYAKAVAEAENWDSSRAATYKLEQASALYKLGDIKGDNDALARAIAVLKDLISTLERENQQREWANAKILFGDVLILQGSRDGGFVLDEGVAAYLDALEVQSVETAPLEWAYNKRRLADALSYMGAKKGDASQLEDAVAVFKETLEVWTQDRSPSEWASAKRSLGDALATLGNLLSEPEMLKEALAAYESALEVQTREHEPLAWAGTQNSIGVARIGLGALGGTKDELEKSVAAIKLALEVQTRDRVPLYWAQAQNNLGVALSFLAVHESGTEALEDAVAAFSAALEELTPERVPEESAAIRADLANAENELSRRLGRR